MANGRRVQRETNPQASGIELPSCSLIDYLQIDKRPTLIYQVTTSRITDVVPKIHHAFSNLAVASSEVLRFIDWKGDVQDYDHLRFNAWLEEESILSRGLTAHFQYEHLWTAALLDSRWLVVSGVKQPQEYQLTATNLSPNRNGTLKPDNTNRALSHHRTKIADAPEISLKHVPFPELPPSDYLTFIRNYDWASTVLGPIETWSPRLLKVCEMVLVIPDPCTVFWGDDLAMIWNEPYLALAGNKHPSGLGQSARRSWGEVWDQYDPLFNQMRIDGKFFKQENSRLLINRNGYLEEGFFHLRVMPVFSEEGVVVGFWEPVIETTSQVLAARRLDTLLKIGESMSVSTSVEEVWKILLDALRGHESDVFFAALYVPGPDSVGNDEPFGYSLKGSVGLDLTGLAPDNDWGFRPIFRVIDQKKSSVVLRTNDGSLSQILTHELQKCGMKGECRSIVVSPLKSGTDASITAMLIIGANPNREYDDDYDLFTQLLVRQIESAVTSMQLFEKERELLKEQAAHQGEKKIQTFAERAPVGIFIFDSAGAIKFCNDAWLDLCGLSRDRIHEPMCWVDTVHPENAPEIVGYWEKISNLEGPQTFEVQYKKPWRPKIGDSNVSLDRTYVLASAYAEVNENGELSGILGCVTDISHVKWAEKIQSQRLEEALELKRQQENFLDITSHEMRNPLNAILHCAMELVENLTSLRDDSHLDRPKASILSSLLEAATTIQYCGTHQKRIIDDVLTVSKLDSDLLLVTPTSTRPSQLVRQVLSVFDTEIRASMIETEVEISDTYRQLDIENVFIDSHRVIQIIINLFSNAIKFLKGESRRHLKIVIGASRVEPSETGGNVRYVPSGRHHKDPTQDPEWGTGEALYLVFSVRDTGPGMTPEEANLLFQRFRQASPRTHAQFGGSGLGLFISRELSELHGGRIGISSQIGLGSTFDFYVKGRRDTSDNKHQLTNTGFTILKARPNDIVARLRDAAMAPDMPQLNHVKSSPSVLQVKETAAHRVLVVEDNLINQQILKKLMRRQGHDVSVANHGQEALAIIESSQWCVGAAPNALRFGLVLCDVEMPVMDGKLTVRKIREMQKAKRLTSQIPVIAVTGNARTEQIKAALDCGFDDVVAKPYEVHDLIQRVKKFMVD